MLSFPLDKRRTLIRKELRKNLFNLFAGWAGRFGQIFGFNTRPANGPNGSCTEFEFSALQAMLAVLCSGPSFDLSKFAEEGEVYRLLDLLLASEDINIYNEGQKAVVMLLEVNPDLSPLLDWLVDRCYTGTNRQVSIGIQTLRLLLLGVHHQILILPDSGTRYAAPDSGDPVDRITEIWWAG